MSRSFISKRYALILAIAPMMLLLIPASAEAG
jgi:hypothetical protein